MAIEVFHHVPLISLFSSFGSGAFKTNQATTLVGCFGHSIRLGLYSFLPFAISHLQCLINPYVAVSAVLHSPQLPPLIYSIMEAVCFNLPGWEKSAKFLFQSQNSHLCCGLIIAIIILLLCILKDYLCNHIMFLYFASCTDTCPYLFREVF